MKRTIKEVYNLIKEKRDNAEKSSRIERVETVRHQLYGQEDAYNDVLRLIESSHLLEK